MESRKVRPFIVRAELVNTWSLLLHYFYTIFLTTSTYFSISPGGPDMLCGTGGYLGSEKAYGAVGGVGGVYPSNYPCYYTNMDYLSPGIQSHSALNVPVSTN